MKNILYTGDSKFKINPAYFDQLITPMVRSTTTNEYGEKVETFTAGTPVRAMVGYLNSSYEEVTVKENQIIKDVIAIITYSNDALSNEKNRILYDGKTLQIKSTQPAYARGRYVRVTAEFIG